MWTDEGRTYIRINQAGYRDRDHTTTKPTGTIRIAVLGDSYTEAFQVPLERTYWSIAEARLSDCASARRLAVEVLNFGVYAYGTAQELLTLRTRVWAYDPDIVVLLFTTGNDVWDNSPELRQDPRRPYFVERDGQLILRPRETDPLENPLKRFYYAAVTQSRVMQLIHRARYLLINQPDNPVKHQAALGGGARIDLAYTEPSTPEARTAWSVTEALLSTMYREVTERGSSFVLFIGTNPVDVHPDPTIRRREMEELGVSDLGYSVRRLVALGDQEGFDVVPLAGPLEEFVARTGRPVHGFDGSGTGHWNEAGHQIAGEVVARELCDRLPTFLR